MHMLIQLHFWQFSFLQENITFYHAPAGWEKSFSRHLGIKFYAFRLNTMAWLQGMTSSDPFNPSGFGLKVFFFRQDI